MNKLTDAEILKALECCLHSGERCNKCELNGFRDCIALHPKDILNLINRQKAEIESLKHRKTELQIRNQELQHEKSEARKELAERLKEEFQPEQNYDEIANFTIQILRNTIDNLLKEMDGE